MARIIVFVNGGVVSEVIADSKGLEVMLVDHDAEESGEELEGVFEPIPVDRQLFRKTLTVAEQLRRRGE